MNVVDYNNALDIAKAINKYIKIKDWVASTAYIVGQYVNNDGVLYKCTTANNDATFDPTNWQKVAGGGLDEWEPSALYSVDDVVIYNNKIYQCNTAHTSGSTFLPDEAKWTEISACITRIPNWVANEDYVVGDLVAYDAKIYRCTTAHTSGSTFDSTEEAKWEELSPTINEISLWAASTDYEVGQLVIYNNKLFRCITAHTSTSNFNNDINNWQEIGSNNIDSWQPSTAYKAGDFVYEDGQIYRCIYTHTSDSSNFYTDISNWELLDTKWRAENWESSKLYKIGDVVLYNNRLFRCNRVNTSSSDFFSDYSYWDAISSKIEVWGTDITYKIGDTIIYNNRLYKCKRAHKSDSSSFLNDINDWELVDGSNIRNWASNEDYVVGDTVIYNRKIFQCKTLHSAGSTFDYTKWNEISSSDIDQWEPSFTYTIGDVVIKDNQLYICSTNHTSTNLFSDNLSYWQVLCPKIFNNAWEKNVVYLTDEMVNIGANWYKAKDSHLSCNTKFEDDFDTHWELIDKFDDWEAGKPYRIGTIVRKDGKLFKCTASTSSGVFDPNSWELYLKCVEDWYPNVNGSGNILVYVDFEYTIDGTPYNYYSDVITGTIEMRGGNWNVPQLGTGASLSSSYGGHTLSTPSHVVNSSNSYTIEFIMVDHSYNNGNFAEPYNNHLYLNTDKSVYVYYLVSPTHKLCVNIGTYSYDWEVAHNGGENNFIHALAFTFTSTGTNLFVDGVLVLETDYVSSDVTFNMHSETSGFASGLMLVDELLITEGVLYSSDYSPTYEPRDKPIGYSYKVGDLVVYDNKLYKCIEENTDGEFDNSKWAEIGGATIDYATDADIDNLFN